jgi:HPt (histidine-containing phosphotransfer) domain-containing protein
MGPVTEDLARNVMRQLWLRNRPTTLERLAVVQRAVEALAAGVLGGDERETARSEAHKLRGILGTYGFAEGSVVAGEAEEMLVEEVDPGGATDLGVRLADYGRTLAEDA